MTNETEMPELCSPYHDGSMQLDTDDWYECGWGWVYLDDYKDLSDAKDKRIEELEAKLAKAVEVLIVYENKLVSFATATDDTADEAEIFLDRDRGKLARNVLAELKGETE